MSRGTKDVTSINTTRPCGDANIPPPTKQTKMATIATTMTRRGRAVGLALVLVALLAGAAAVDAREANEAEVDSILVCVFYFLHCFFDADFFNVLSPCCCIFP